MTPTEPKNKVPVCRSSPRARSSKPDERTFLHRERHSKTLPKTWSLGRGSNVLVPSGGAYRRGNVGTSGFQIHPKARISPNQLHPAPYANCLCASRCRPPLVFGIRQKGTTVTLESTEPGNKMPNAQDKPFDLIDQVLFALNTTMTMYFLYECGQNTHLSGVWHQMLAKNNLDSWFWIVFASVFWGFCITGGMRKWSVLYLLFVLVLVML